MNVQQSADLQKSSLALPHHSVPESVSRDSATEFLLAPTYKESVSTRLPENPGRAEPPSSRLNWRFLLGLRRLIRLISSSPGKPPIWGGQLAGYIRPYLFLLILVAVQAYNVAGFFSVLVPSLFYSALTSSSGTNSETGALNPTDAIDETKLKNALQLSALYLSVTVIAKVVMTFAVEFSSLQWRDALTCTLQSRYLRSGAFYHVQVSFPGLDNPDQRVSLEVSKFCTVLGGLVSTLGQAVFNIIYYSVKIHALTGSMFGPGLIYAYAVIGLGSTQLVASPIASLVASAEAAEGHYRRLLVGVGSSAEAVALSGCAVAEQRALTASFSQILQLRGRIVLRHLGLNLLTYFMDYAGSAVNYLILAAAVLAGVFSTHEQVITAIAKGSGFTLMVIFGFSQIVDAATKITELAGYTTRLVSLLDAVESVSIAVAENATEETNSGKRFDFDSPSLNAEDESVLLEFRNIPLPRPELFPMAGIPLQERREAMRQYSALESSRPCLSFSVSPGELVLLMGPSGSGKTSLLRTLRGLWRLDPELTPLHGPLDGNNQQDRLLKCAPLLLTDDERTGPRCILLPQECYLLPRGSLRDQLAYPQVPPPDSSGRLGTEQVLALLDEVGLPAQNVLAKCGGNISTPVSNWECILPPGQRQLLACARMFYHAPQLALLDEVTSSLSTEAEANIYKCLRERQIGVLSIGHRSSLIPLHDKVIQISSD